MSAHGVSWTGLGPSRLIGEKGVRALCPAGGWRLDRSHSKGPLLAVDALEAPLSPASPSRSLHSHPDGDPAAGRGEDVAAQGP